MGEPLPVPPDLRSLVTDRLQGLTEPARQLLLAAGALARPTVTAITAAATDEEEGLLALTEVVRAGLVELDGERLHFTHPLIASIPYADLIPTARRRLHQRLAAVVSDPEEHARHAALGSPARLAPVADALDVAAGYARRRGSIDAAAEFAELAVSRTPIDDLDALLRRTVDAAQYLFLLGETSRARAILGDGLRCGATGTVAGTRTAAGRHDRVMGAG